MFLFREHRGGLAESLKTQVKLADRAALIAHIENVLRPCSFLVSDSVIDIAFYANDRRMPEWEETFIVTLQGYGVLGFTNERPK